MTEDEEIELEREAAFRLAVENFDSEAEVHRRFDPGSFGSHEAGDRIWIQAEIVDHYLLNAPTVVMNKEAYKMIYQARRLLFDAYQVIACADPIVEDKNVN